MIANSDIEKLIKLADSDEIWRAYLLEKIITADDPAHWLFILKARGYFDPKNNPAPYSKEQGYLTTPYWEVSGYLEKVSNINKLNAEKEVTKTLKEIIESLIRYRGADGKRVENIRTDNLIVKMIFDLPLESITKEYLDFVKTAFNVNQNMLLLSSEISKIIEYLIEKKASFILADILDTILDFDINKESYFDKFSSKLEDYYLEELANKYQKKLLEICGPQLYEMAMNKITRMIKIDEKTFSGIMTIEDSNQNISGAYKTILISFLREFLKDSPAKEVRPKILELITEQNIIFRRLAIYLISIRYNDLQDIFWKLQINPLNDIMLKHELYNLFDKNCKYFSETQIQLLLTWIETQDSDHLREYYKEKPDELEVSLAHRKKEWLTSLLKTSNRTVFENYQKCSKLFPSEIEHPGYLIWSSGVTVSPLPSVELKEGLKDKTNAQISLYLKDYKKEPKTPHDFIPDPYALERGFTDYVENNALTISQDLDAFSELPYNLQHSILVGLRKVWESKQAIEWNKILDFCLKTVEAKTFRNGTNDHDQAELLTKSIAELIMAGIKDEKNMIDFNYFPVVERILLALADNDKSSLNPSNMKLFDNVINSSKGAIYSAILTFAIRYASIKKQKIFKQEISSYLERCINNDETPIELYVTIGEYFPNIHYLDSEWAKLNINKLFPKDKEQLWQGTFTGYVYGTSTLYTQIFQLLKSNHDYSKAIITDFGDSFVAGRVVEHICIAYLNGLDDIGKPDSLIDAVMEQANTEKIWILRILFGAFEKNYQKPRRIKYLNSGRNKSTFY